MSVIVLSEAWLHAGAGTATAPLIRRATAGHRGDGRGEKERRKRRDCLEKSQAGEQGRE